jgi:hypothetical protein
MRAAFLKAEPYLDVEVGREVEVEMNKRNAVAGWSECTRTRSQSSSKRGREDSSQVQRATSADEAERLISKGWMYIGTLPTGKVVLQRGARNKKQRARWDLNPRPTA